VSTGVAKNSLHLAGRAIDVRLTSAKTDRLARRGDRDALRRVGYYRDSNFVHIDTGDFRTCSRESRLRPRADPAEVSHRREPSSYILSGVSTSIESWRHELIAYEDALASFYALQDRTLQSLEQSVELLRAMERLASLRRSIFVARRESPICPARTTELSRSQRDSASIEVAGAPLLATTSLRMSLAQARFCT
jgi:hypothetical protein